MLARSVKSSSKRNFHCLPNTRNTFPNLFLYFGGVAWFRFLYCYFIESFRYAAACARLYIMSRVQKGGASCAILTLCYYCC